MTKLFKKLFIKNYQDVENPVVRVAYGIAAGALGIVANVILFAIKLTIGLITSSVSIIADSLNNLFVDIKNKAFDVFNVIIESTKKFNIQSIEKQLINSLSQYIYQIKDSIRFI